MARRHGSKGKVMMDPTGATSYVVVASLDKWTLSLATDKAEVTSFQDPNKVYVQGVPDIKGTVGGNWDDADLSLFNVALGTVAPALELFPSTLGPPTAIFKGPAWMDANIDVDAKGKVSIGGNFVAAGAWTGPSLT